MVRMSFIYVIGRYSASAITLASLSAFTHFITPYEYGIYALVIALATALYATFGQWLRHVLLRFAQPEIDGKAPLPSLILKLFLVICIALALIALAVSPFLSEEALYSLYFAFPLLVFMGLFELSIAWFQFKLRPASYVGLSILRTGLAAVLGVTTLYFGFGSSGLILSALIAYGIAFLPLFIITSFGLGSAKPALTYLKPMLAYGLPLAVSAALGSALILADRAIIAALISTEAAGLYAAPYDLAMRTLQVLLLAINLAGTPLIIRAFESNDLIRTSKLLERQWVLLVCTGFPVMLFLVFIPQGIASILLGPSFRQAGADLMPIVAIATFIQGLESFYFSFVFALSKKPLKQTYILIIAVIINVILTIWLVPILGMRGGAWATLLSSIVALFGSIFIGSSLQKLPLALNELIRIALAAFPMTVILILLAPDTPFHTILTGLLALSLYVLALFGLNVAGLRQILLRFLRLQLATLYSKGELK